MNLYLRSVVLLFLWGGQVVITVHSLALVDKVDISHSTGHNSHSDSHQIVDLHWRDDVYRSDRKDSVEPTAEVIRSLKQFLQMAKNGILPEKNLSDNNREQIILLKASRINLKSNISQPVVLHLTYNGENEAASPIYTFQQIPKVPQFYPIKNNLAENLHATIGPTPLQRIVTYKSPLYTNKRKGNEMSKQAAKVIRVINKTNEVNQRTKEEPIIKPEINTKGAEETTLANFETENTTELETKPESTTRGFISFKKHPIIEKCRRAVTQPTSLQEMIDLLKFLNYCRKFRDELREKNRVKLKEWGYYTD